MKTYKLKLPIGRSYNLNGDDVLAVKTALSDVGYLSEPNDGHHPYPDDALFNAIQEFQADHGLKVDGVMKPGGETETALAARSHRYVCTSCGAFHGGVLSAKLCADCFMKAS